MLPQTKTTPQTIVFIVDTHALTHEYNAGRNRRRASEPISFCTSPDQVEGWLYQNDFQAGQEAYFLGNDLPPHPCCQAYLDGYNYVNRCERSNIAEMFDHEANDPISCEPGYRESLYPWQY